jgi:hypothetical protein
MREPDSSLENGTPSAREKYRSVQWKILARQLPILFILFVILLFWLENHLEDAFYATHLESVRRLSEMVVASVETSMESKEKDRIWDRVERLLHADRDTRLQVINKRCRTFLFRA